MASPECITLDSGSDSEVEFVCEINGGNKPTSTNKLKNVSKTAKREVDFIPIVDLDKDEEKPKEAGIFKRSGRKMVSDAVEIVSSISAVHEDNNTMKIEQVFSLTMSDNNESTPQKRRRISTTVIPRPASNSPQLNQQRQSTLQKTTKAMPRPASNSPQLNQQRQSTLQKTATVMPRPASNSPQLNQQRQSTLQKTTTVMPRPASNSPQLNQQRLSTLQKTSAQGPLQRNVTPHRSSPQMKPTLPSKPSQLTQKDDQKKRIKIVPVPSLGQKHILAGALGKAPPLNPKPSPSKPKPSLSKPPEPIASSSHVPNESIVLSDTEDEKSEESEHDSENESSPNVKLSKELIMKLVDVCLNSKLREDLKTKIKEKLTRYTDAASPNVLKRNYFIRMVKDIIKDVEAILDCAEIYESHEVTLCDKIKAIVAELKKDSLIVNNKLIKLTNIYNKLKRRIQRLEEKEVDTDDESLNPYLLLDKYQKRATVVYNKMCEIQNIGNHADRPYLLPFSFKGKGPDPVERALEVYYNKTRKFPNFKEVLKLTKKVNEEKKLGMSEPEVNYTAQSVFTDFGRRLQMRRQRDDYHNLVGYIKDGERDPAAEDPELHRKLEMNKHLYITKEQEVLDSYVKKQAMKEGKKNADESEEESNHTDSSDGESEDEGKHSDKRSRSSSEEKSPKKHKKEDSPEKDTDEKSSEKVKGMHTEKEKTPEISSRSNSEEKSPKKPIREDSPKKDTEEKSKGSNEKVISKEKKPEIPSRSNSEEKSSKKAKTEDSPKKDTEEKSSENGKGTNEKVIYKEKKPKIPSRSNSEEKSSKKEDSQKKDTEEKSSEKGKRSTEKVISKEKTPEIRTIELGKNQ